MTERRVAKSGQVYGWFVCRCGKEFEHHIGRPGDPDELLVSYEKLMEHTTCRACGADWNRSHDRCPENVGIPGGVSACRLTWEHEGRCEPFALLARGVSGDNPT